MNYFSAKEAEEMTKAVVDGVMDKELQFIYGEIRKDISQGKRLIKFYNTQFSEATVSYLLSKGFTVEHFKGDQRDPHNDISISW